MSSDNHKNTYSNDSSSSSSSSRSSSSSSSSGVVVSSNDNIFALVLLCEGSTGRGKKSGMAVEMWIA